MVYVSLLFLTLYERIITFSMWRTIYVTKRHIDWLWNGYLVVVKEQILLQGIQVHNKGNYRCLRKGAEVKCLLKFMKAYLAAELHPFWLPVHQCHSLRRWWVTGGTDIFLHVKTFQKYWICSDSIAESSIISSAYTITCLSRMSQNI